MKTKTRRAIKDRGERHVPALTRKQRQRASERKLRRLIDQERREKRGT